MAVEMKKSRRSSFGNRLTLYILSVCTVIFLIIFMILYVLPRIFQYDNAVTYTDILAENTSDKIKQKGILVERTVSLLIRESSKDLLLEGDSVFYRTILSSYPEICGCAIEFDPEYRPYDFFAYRNRGSIYFKQLPHETDSFSPERLVVEARENRSSHWSDYYYGYSHVKQRIFSRFEPLYDQSDRFIGFLRLDVVLEEFTRFVDELHFFKTGYAYLVDKKGLPVTHPNPEIRIYNGVSDNREKLHSEYAEVIKTAMNQENRIGKIKLDGIDFFVYFKKVPFFDWSIVMLCPFHEIYDNISRISDIILIGCIVCLALLFGVVIQVIKRVFKPLQQFSIITRTIADGHFNVPIPVINRNDEIRELRDSFVYMQQKIIDSMEYLKSTTQEKEKIESEIRVAQRIQERFLPGNNRLNEERFSLYAVLEQSKSVGGDMYGYFVKHNKLYIVEGDVRGKGMPAALYMSSISTLYNYVATTQKSTADICSILNEYLCSGSEDDMFITMFFGILDLNTGILNYTNAGHPSPIIKRKQDESVGFLEGIDIPLGVMINQYKDYQIQLSHDDMLLIYTDGITEAQNESSEFYGKENLLQLSRKTTAEGPEELIDTVLTDLVAYIGDMNESDDMTMVAIQYKETDQQAG